MASIKAKPNGTYLITVSLGRDRNQKQLFERITFKPTKTTPKAIEKEVQQFATEFEKRVKEGEFFSGEKITFIDFMNEWEKNWAVDHLTQSVREGYVDILERRVIPAIVLFCKYIFPDQKEKTQIILSRKQRSGDSKVLVNSAFYYLHFFYIIGL